jgi:hypothetical protein
VFGFTCNKRYTLCALDSIILFASEVEIRTGAFLDLAIFTVRAPLGRPLVPLSILVVQDSFSAADSGESVARGLWLIGMDTPRAAEEG